MKKVLFLSIAIVCFSFSSKAESKIAKIKVKASIYCDHCQKCESCGTRLENAIYNVKGVKRMDLNLTDNSVEVVYNSAKTNPEKIREAITEAGFDADDVKGNQDAYAKWDECCKK